MKYKPMMAVLGDESVLERKGFIFEPKLDGYRALCSFKNKKLTFLTRNGNDLTSDFPELTFSKYIDAKSAVLDGEIVIYNEKGIPDFHMMQNRKEGGRLPAYFIVFDILEKNGKDLTDKTLEERKKILDKTIKEGNHLQKVVFTTDGKKLWNIVKKKKLEGIIAKNFSSRYIGARHRDWVKIKITNTIDAVIIGYTSERRALSSLLLGIYDGGTLTYIGNVGTGFNQRNTEVLMREFSALRIDKEVVAKTGQRNVTWVLPKLVAEVKYSEVTHDKKLRAPVFIGLREDKAARECTWGSQVSKS